MSERYEIREKIGQGGRGFVYRAVDTRLKREVAVKRIPVEPGATPAQIEKIGETLMKEATAMSVLNHPNIVSIYDVVQDSEGGFVVMELLNGETLHDVVKRNVLTLEDFHSVAQQTLGALTAAGASNMLHRDLKPGNIMLVWLPTKKFQVKILDFGLAKISAQPSLQTVEHGRSIVGTIYFMAPEQFELRELSAATDLYAMGCVYYFCLTGKYPFDGDSMAKVMTAHLQGTYIPLDKLRPDLPRHVCQWVMWLMNRDVQNRPQSASEALDLLPLATSQDGQVYVVDAVDIEDQPEEEDVGTGEVHVVKPADLVADPGRQHSRPEGLAPALRNTGMTGLEKAAITSTGPSPSTTSVPRTNTGRIQPSPPSTATTGRVPTLNTGRVPRMNTGRVQTMSQGGTGPVSTAVPTQLATQRSGFNPVWIFVVLVPVLCGVAFGAFKFSAAADYPIRFRDTFTNRSGLLHASAPAKPPFLLAGRKWIGTPGLKFTDQGLQADAGRQLATFDISGAYAPEDTIRISVLGLTNPHGGWFGIGLSDRTAPGVIEEDLTGWVQISGDHHGAPGSGALHELGSRKKNIGFPKDFWQIGSRNDLEIVLNCKTGDAALFINGVRAVIGALKTGGFPTPPSQLALVFSNIQGASVARVSFENLGVLDLQDVGPATKADRDFLMNLPAPPVPGTTPPK